jgi:hypothetical protein
MEKHVVRSFFQLTKLFLWFGVCITGMQGKGRLSLHSRWQIALHSLHLAAVLPKRMRFSHGPHVSGITRVFCWKQCSLICNFRSGLRGLSRAHDSKTKLAGATLGYDSGYIGKKLSSLKSKCCTIYVGQSGFGGSRRFGDRLDDGRCCDWTVLAHG